MSIEIKETQKEYNKFMNNYPNKYYISRLQLWCNDDVFKKYVIVQVLNRANLLRYNKKGWEDTILCKLLLSHSNNLLIPTSYRNTSPSYVWSKNPTKIKENKIILKKVLTEAENIKKEFYTQIFQKTKIPNMLFSLIIKYIHGDSLTDTQKSSFEDLD
jgi:hypothetical protein